MSLSLNKKAVSTLFLLLSYSLCNNSFAQTFKKYDGVNLLINSSAQYAVYAQSNKIVIHDNANETDKIIGENSGIYPTNISISDDACRITFDSNFSNLPGDTNGYSDVFLYDCATDSIRLVSHSFDGGQSDNISSHPSISQDGKYIAYFSRAGNLISNDLNPAGDIFLYDVESGQNSLVHVASDGTQGNQSAAQEHPGISADGQFISFASMATNLVNNDWNYELDVFLHDRSTGTTTQVSIGPNGQQPERYHVSGHSSLSPDGRYVTYYSDAHWLTGNYLIGNHDIHLYDRTTGLNRLVSTSIYGEENNRFCNSPKLSKNGRFVLFASAATNLVPDNTGSQDIYLKDLQTGEVDVVNARDEGIDYLFSYWKNRSMSENGRYIGYTRSDYYSVVRDMAKDEDGDGFVVFKDIVTDDCNDHDADIKPGAEEIPYNGIDENCNGMADDDDLDRDGYGIATDCNDNDASINPGATEICDGIDNNCDGQIDEGFDADNDGFTVCQGDLYDNDPAINPGAIEICDGVDNNCDGLIDEGFDADNDGFTVCQGDLYDNDPSINPGATEICDGIDNNCDGQIDEGFDVDHDGYTVCQGDLYDNDPAINPAATEICDGIDNNCDGQIDEGFDADNDGYTVCQGDLYDNDPAINPGATETKHDGIDQDCNGYDLTIDVTATYKANRDRLTVDATSSLGAAANLVLDGYGPMTYSGNRWSITIQPAGGNPGSVSITGIEGTETATVQ